jgi:hypothetical protein
MRRVIIAIAMLSTGCATQMDNRAAAAAAPTPSQLRAAMVASLPSGKGQCSQPRNIRCTPVNAAASQFQCTYELNRSQSAWEPASGILVLQQGKWDFKDGDLDCNFHVV